MYPEQIRRQRLPLVPTEYDPSYGELPQIARRLQVDRFAANMAIEAYCCAIEEKSSR